ncbi:helix-turn-helix domain-containing protein [Lunatibacter salilacus]|uniref:helix-turn-helix domain-containing protein n=1 Tax=Lunatibacter salilacus TaxID=2483804 RepID=UPI00131D1213|nr:AraC family transcriptional regulator [Lunatibacter salilacus]
METNLPLQISLQPYLLKAYHFKLGLKFISLLNAIPKGNIFLFFIWGKGTWDHRKAHNYKINNPGGIYVLGQQFEIFKFSTNYDELDIIGFELNPIVFQQVFGISTNSIVNEMVCINDKLSLDLVETNNPVSGEVTLANQLKKFENLLWKKIQTKSHITFDDLNQAISIIDFYGGNICIKNLAEMLQMGTRSLERRFHTVLGVTPKTYSKIIQFNNAFRMMVQTNRKIVEIAHEAGYYDQAHFVNHFRKICGMCPSQFWAERNLTHGNGIPKKIRTKNNRVGNTFYYENQLYFY